MGSWSPSAFGDDLALALQREFDLLTLGGANPRDAAHRLMKDNSGGGIVVLASLAELMLDCGLRSDPILDQAFQAIERGDGLDRLRESGSWVSDERATILKQLALRIRKARELAEQFPKPARSPWVKVGDIYQIPLLAGGYAYSHYVHLDPNNGPLLAVLDTVYATPVSSSVLDYRSYMFPPVICGIRHAVREGIWQIVGRAPTDHFVFPQFKSGVPDKQGVVHTWWIFDGKCDVRIDGELPDRYKNLESLSIYPPSMIEARITKHIQQRTDWM